MKWLHAPVRILVIHFSYDKKGNNEWNINLKVRKLQTNLDMGRSRDLTLMIVKSLGLLKLIRLASIIDIPEEITSLGKKTVKLFMKKTKMTKKRGGDKGGLWITTTESFLKLLYSPGFQDFSHKGNTIGKQCRTITYGT